MRRWESLPTLTQAAVAFPLFGLLLFFVSGAIVLLSFCGQAIVFSRPDRRGLPDLMAKTVVIKRGGYHHGYGARAEFREHRDRGWHEGWRHHRHADKVVIIKHHRHEY